MPTLNFTQFGAPTTVIPKNDYVVGYNYVNGTNIEAKWSMEKLAQTALPNAGLGSRLHQIRKLARVNFEGTYSMAAITRREEVVCWGNNVRSNPKTPANTPGAGRSAIPLNNQFTKFGAGYESVHKAASWQPVIIPFMSGTPGQAGAENSDLVDLYGLGLTIEDLIWDEWSAMARLSDGSVWIKGLVGPQEHIGFAPGDMPANENQTHYTSAFYKVTNFDTHISGALVATHIETLPRGVPVCGGLFAVIDQYNDLHIWGRMYAGGAVAYSVWPGAPTATVQTTPVNVTKSASVDIRQKVREVKLGGDISHFHVIFAQIITTENKLFSIGYNEKGNLGTGEANLVGTAPITNWNKVNWTAAKYQNPDDDNIILVENAWKFIDSKYNFHFTGYIGLSSLSTGVNRIFTTGSNENVGTNVNAVALFPNNVSTTTAVNCYYTSRGTSGGYDPFIKGFINSDHTLVAITRQGAVYSCGRNTKGEAGRTAIPANSQLVKVTYRAPYGSGPVSTPQFGQAGQLSAVDVHYCCTTQAGLPSDGHITALTVAHPDGSRQLYVAGKFPYTNAIRSTAGDSTFRIIPIRENVQEVYVGGTLGSAEFIMVHTREGRTYGIGKGPHGLLGDSASMYVPSAPTLVYYVVRARSNWYTYY